MGGETSPEKQKETPKEKPKEGQQKDKVLDKAAKVFLEKQKDADVKARQEKGHRMLGDMADKLKDSSIVGDLINLLKTSEVAEKLEKAEKRLKAQGEKIDLTDQKYLLGALLEIFIDGDTSPLRTRLMNNEINVYEFSKIILDKKMAAKLNSANGAELTKWKGVEATYKGILAGVEKAEADKEKQPKKD